MGGLPPYQREWAGRVAVGRSTLLLQKSRQELQPVVESSHGSACGDSAATDGGGAWPRRSSGGLGAAGLPRGGFWGVAGHWRFHGQARPAWGWKAQACAPAKRRVAGGSGFISSGRSEEHTS